MLVTMCMPGVMLLVEDLGNVGVDVYYACIMSVGTWVVTVSMWWWWCRLVASGSWNFDGRLEGGKGHYAIGLTIHEVYPSGLAAVRGRRAEAHSCVDDLEVIWLKGGFEDVALFVLGERWSLLFFWCFPSGGGGWGSG